MGGTRVRRYVGRLAAITTLSGMSVIGAPLVSGAATPKRAANAVDAQVQEAAATLVVEQPNVELRREGKDEFRPAKDGAELHEGDTVRTDATGRATIEFTDKSFTRLAESTEFTIVELTDDQGTRHTTGNLSVGKAWNRVEDLTESEAFETEGAGATAAVDGTAYAVACLNPAACWFDGVVHDVKVTGNLNGPGTKSVDELQKVLVTLGVVGDVELMTLEEFYGDEWIQQNLAIDAFLGFESPDWQKNVIVQTNEDGTIQVAGVVVFAPAVVNNPSGGGTPPIENPPPGGGGGGGTPPPPPPPPTNPGQGFGAGGGTNKGGASFDNGTGRTTGNCMSQGAGQGHGHGQPDPAACLGS